MSLKLNKRDLFVLAAAALFAADRSDELNQELGDDDETGVVRLPLGDGSQAVYGADVLESELDRLRRELALAAYKAKA